MISKLMARLGRRKRPTHRSTRKNQQTTTNKVMKPKSAKVSTKSAMATARKKRPRPISTRGTDPDAFDEMDPIVAAAEEQQRAVQEALRTEALARDAAPKRWNAAIDPSSDAFKAKHKEFRTALRDPAKTPYGIINSCFTAHEKAMLIPVDRRSNPALYKIQADNRVRYQALLKSDRFIRWAARADLAFKFTLMHYGLPVAPMNVGFEQDLSDWEEDSDEDGALQQNDRPPGGYLRFLNSYGVRHFGQRSLRDPDPTYEKYYTFEGLNPVNPKTAIYPIDFDAGDTLTLRGGGDSDDMDIDIDRLDAEVDLESVDFSNPETDPWSEGDPEDAQSLSMVMSLRGGASLPAPETDSVRKSNRQVYPYKTTRLYGFQGFVHFDPHHISSFVDAFDRVLGVRARDGIQVLLAVYDRKVDYYGTEELPEFLTVVMGPQDDRTAFQRMLKWAAPYIMEPDSHSKYALFVCPGPVLLPKNFEPDSLVGKDVMFLKVDNPDQPRDCAYLRIPPNNQELMLWRENIYSPGIEAAARLLSPSKFASNPGKPEIPDAFFGSRADPNCTPAYGGLSFPPQEFASVIEASKEKQATEMFATHLLRVLDISELRQIGWPIHIPGHCLPIDEEPWGVPYDMADIAPGIIEAAIEEALHPVAFEEATHIDVWFPGDRMYHCGDIGKYTIDISRDGDKPEESESDHPLSQALQRLVGDSHENDQLQLDPRFISVSPRWSRYHFVDANNADNIFHLNHTMGLALFELELEACGASDSSGTPFARDQASVIISHASCNWKCAPESRVEVVMPKTTMTAATSTQSLKKTPVIDTTRPSFLLTHKISEREFQFIFRKITSPYLIVEVVYPDVELITDFQKQPWGYRDIYSIENIFGEGKPGPNEVQRCRLPRKGSEHSTRPATSAKPTTSNKKATEPSGNTKQAAVRFTTPPPPQAAQSKPPDGAPPNFYGLKPTPFSQPLSDQERGRKMRELTWYKAPSVHTHMTIPINAPPVEAILKTGTDSVPSFSLGVLTPTEQQKMRMDYYNIRNIALQRSQKCPYYGCKRVFKISENDKLQHHLLNVHAADKCNFCDELLYKHWNEEQRRYHFFSSHYNSFVHNKDLRRQNNKVKIPFEGHVNRDRESLWSFCARCGRDHRELDVNADRNNHDNICYPKALDNPDRWKPCEDCGDWIRNSNIPTHECRPGADPAERPYCRRCALPLGRFTYDYLHIHSEKCKGRSNVDDKFCPWCGVNLGDSSSGKLGHLRVCGKRPDEKAEGPIDLQTGKLWPTPAEILARGTPIATGTKQKAGPVADVKILQEEVRALKHENDWLKKHQADEIAKLRKIGEDHLKVELRSVKDQLSALLKANASNAAQTSPATTSYPHAKGPTHQHDTQPSMVSTGTQTTQPTHTSRGTQTDQPTYISQGTQIDQPAYISQGSQTDQPTQTTQGTQTAQPPLPTRTTQSIQSAQTTQSTQITQSTPATQVTHFPVKHLEDSMARKRKITAQSTLDGTYRQYSDSSSEGEDEYDGRGRRDAVRRDGWGDRDAVMRGYHATTPGAGKTGRGRKPLKKLRRAAEPDPRFRPEGTPPSDKEDDLKFEDFVRASGGIEKDI